MGKIIDKVRQREFDAMLNRRYMQRNTFVVRNTTQLVANPMLAFGGMNGVPDFAAIKESIRELSQPLPKPSNSG